MYPYAPTAARTREIWLNTVNRVSGMIPPGSVQEATILGFVPLNNISRLAEIKLASNDEKAITPLQKLLPQMRIAELFAIGVGIARVPTDEGVTMWGNAQYTSDPDSPIFSAAERVALRHVYNGVLTLETNGTKRLDALHTSDFQIVTQDMAANTVKPRMLPATYTIVGGEPNSIFLSMPDVGNLAPLADDATRKLYVVIKAQVINIVAGSESSKQAIASKLRGQ